MKIKYKIQKLSPSMKRYFVIGISVYLMELLIIVVAQALGASPTVAVAYSFWLGLGVSFGLQKFITFGDRRVHHKVLIPQIVLYSLLVVFNFGFTVLLTRLLQDVVPAVVTRTLAIGCTTIWNFYLYKTRIFRTDDNPVY